MSCEGVRVRGEGRCNSTYHYGKGEGGGRGRTQSTHTVTDTCKSSHPHQAMYIWVCKDVAVQFIDQLFGVTAFEMIPEVMVCVSYSHMLLCMCCAYQV